MYASGVTVDVGEMDVNRVDCPDVMGSLPVYEATGMLTFFGKPSISLTFIRIF